MSFNQIKESICNVPDFPKPGIQFKDITTLLQHRDVFNEVINIFYKKFKDQGIDVIVGIESRGFLFASPLALKMGCSLVLARKPGKLPREILSKEYELEYGTDSIEIHKDDIRKNDRVLIIDDLLATGGTAKATASLIERMNGTIVSFGFLIELSELNGSVLLKPNNVFSIICE